MIDIRVITSRRKASGILILDISKLKRAFSRVRRTNVPVLCQFIDRDTGETLYSFRIRPLNGMDQYMACATECYLRKLCVTDMCKTSTCWGTVVSSIGDVMEEL